MKKMRILHDISFKLKVISAWWDFAEFPGSDVVIWSGDELKAARFERGNIHSWNNEVQARIDDRD